MSWFEDYRKRSLEDKIDDTLDYLQTWGFALKPSEKRRYLERYDKLQKKYFLLTGEDRK